jgi:hypothetical protein
MNSACEKRNDCGTRIGSRGSRRSPGYRGFSVTRRPWSSSCDTGGKNALRDLRTGTPDVLRPQDSSGAGSFLRRSACLAGCGGPTRFVPELREGEARESGVAGRQPVLHEAFFLLGGATVPCLDDPGCRPGDAPGLEDDQGAGEAVHGGPTAASGNARSTDHRDRRTLCPKGGTPTASL